MRVSLGRWAGGTPSSHETPSKPEQDKREGSRRADRGSKEGRDLDHHVSEELMRVLSDFADDAACNRTAGNPDDEDKAAERHPLALKLGVLWLPVRGALSVSTHFHQSNSTPVVPQPPALVPVDLRAARRPPALGR
jgi:hypothetical protein